MPAIFALKPKKDVPMPTLSRRHLLALLATLAAARPLAAETLPKVHVAKDPGCGCCNDWIGHIRDAGFPVSFEEMEAGKLADLKASLGLKPEQVSCHTAQVEGYVHRRPRACDGCEAPAGRTLSAVRNGPTRLACRCRACPLARSPGMGPESEREPYQVLLVARDGNRPACFDAGLL
jgi:hypothetical protein